jgi:serine/threonine-protein kinase
MGVVYRALDPVLNRAVAIKVMSDALARDDELRGRFLREAQAAGSLQHPNVITIYDFGEVDGHPYIAMEYVEGADLEAVLQRRTPMSMAQKIDVLVDVLGGLSYAHRRGIVHRDIKPANIRIDAEGRARIMDFGIAHLSSSKMTRTGLMVGTPAYMAPEQVTGGGVVPATDIFSVGAVMYELFTGVKPFEGESLQSVFYKIVSAAPADMTLFDPALPPVLNTIAQTALAKEPSARYASALDMANALTAARAELDRATTHSKSVSLRSAIETGLSTRPAMQARTSRSRRIPWIAAAGAIVALGVGAFVLTRFRRGSGSPATTVQSTPTSAPEVVQPAGTSRVPNAPNEPPAVSKPPATEIARSLEARSANAKPDAKQPETKKTDTKPSAQELELFRTLEASALDARRRAADAGATLDQLRSGDDYNKVALALVQDGKMTDAISRLTAATNAWAGAERDARAAAASAASAVAAANRPKAPPVEVVKTDPIPVQPPAATSPAPPHPAPPNPSVEIAGAVATYARAIESRDVAEVKRAYPGATAQQLKGFEEFFGAVRSLRATLSVTSLDVNGTSAEAHLTGAYDYVTSDGKNQRQPLAIQASFRRDGSAWKLMSVRSSDR